ncbi:MAG: hypothetical protein ACM3JH_14435 [Acidithiobacillales bacterium]
MRKLPVILLALACGGLSAQTVEGWGKTRWGMTAAQAREALKPLEPLSMDHDLVLHFDAFPIAGRPFVVNLYFLRPESKLSFVNSYPVGPVEAPEALYEKVLNELVERYGRPSVNKRAEWGNTRARHCVWALGPTAIRLDSLIDGSRRDWNFTYSPTWSGTTICRKNPYLQPSELTGVPDSLRKGMENLGCLIPQTCSQQKQQNVISGRFLMAEKESWAALCSRGGTSAVLVFSGTENELQATLNARLDSGSLDWGKDYFRRISVIGPARITDLDKDHGPGTSDKMLPPLFRPTHDGIADGYTGKGLAIHYFDGRHWLELEGGD